MTDPRPEPTGNEYTRMVLCVDTSQLQPDQLDALVNAVLAVVEQYSPAAHVEIPLGLMH